LIECSCQNNKFKVNVLCYIILNLEGNFDKQFLKKELKSRWFCRRQH